MNRVYLGLGSNLGDREGQLREALQRLKQIGTLERVSSIYETEPWGYRDQPWFLNLVCLLRTPLDPFSLLDFLKTVERQMGRVPSFRNAPRPIDLDILLYNDLVLETPTLTIPHPRLAERAFVLVPLAEIAPDLHHPLLARSIKELAAGHSLPRIVSSGEGVG